MDTQQKMQLAREMKAVGDEAFKSSDLPKALMQYHQALMYLKGLDKNALNSVGMAPASSGEAAKEKTEADEMMEKIYANQCMCHMKKGNWKRVVETADAALKLNEKNHKAMFRKAKALGEIGYSDQAIKLLEKVKEVNPDDLAMVDAEISRLRTLEAERQKARDKKLKGFLNKAGGI